MSNVIHVTRVADVAYGSLVVYHYYSSGVTTIHLLDKEGKKLHTYYAEVNRRQDGHGREVYAATFPTLPTGTYLVYQPGSTSYGEKRVTIFPGAVAEVRY